MPSGVSLTSVSGSLPFSSFAASSRQSSRLLTNTSVGGYLAGLPSGPAEMRRDEAIGGGGTRRAPVRSVGRARRARRSAVPAGGLAESVGIGVRGRRQDDDLGERDDESAGR